MIGRHEIFVIFLVRACVRVRLRVYLFRFWCHRDQKYVEVDTLTAMQDAGGSPVRHDLRLPTVGLPGCFSSARGLDALLYTFKASLSLLCCGVRYIHMQFGQSSVRSHPLITTTSDRAIFVKGYDDGAGGCTPWGSSCLTLCG